MAISHLPVVCLDWQSLGGHSRTLAHANETVAERTERLYEALQAARECGGKRSTKGFALPARPLRASSRASAQLERPSPSAVWDVAYSERVAGRRPSRPVSLPDSPLTTPKGKQAPSGWADKIAEAIRARDSAKEARRGRPVGF